MVIGRAIRQFGRGSWLTSTASTSGHRGALQQRHLRMLSSEKAEKGRDFAKERFTHNKESEVVGSWMDKIGGPKVVGGICFCVVVGSMFIPTSDGQKTDEVTMPTKSE
jgi:hypothetical protein